MTPTGGHREKVYSGEYVAYRVCTYYNMHADSVSTVLAVAKDGDCFGSADEAISG